MKRHRRRPRREFLPSAFAGFRFPAEVILLAVRWYPRYGLSHRDLEELLAKRGSRSTTSVSIAGCSGHSPPGRRRPPRHAAGDRWFVDETYLKVSGIWKYLYRAVDQFTRVIEVMLSQRRDGYAARRFFQKHRWPRLLCLTPEVLH